MEDLKKKDECNHDWNIVIRTFTPTGARKSCDSCGSMHWKKGFVEYDQGKSILVDGEEFVTLGEIICATNGVKVTDDPLHSYVKEDASEEVVEAMMDDGEDIHAHVANLDAEAERAIELEAKIAWLRMSPFEEKNFASVGNGTTDGEVAAHIANKMLINWLGDLI